MWAILSRYRSSPNFILLIPAWHDWMVGRVCNQNLFFDQFHINGSLKQGCLLAPKSFFLYTIVMLSEIPPDALSIDFCFHMDGRVFNLARLCAKTKTPMCLLWELQYADNNAILSQSVEDLQTLADTHNTTYTGFEMKVNKNKKMLVQHPPGQLFQNTNTYEYPAKRRWSILISTHTCNMWRTDQGNPLHLHLQSF